MLQEFPINFIIVQLLLQKHFFTEVQCLNWCHHFWTWILQFLYWNKISRPATGIYVDLTWTISSLYSPGQRTMKIKIITNFRKGNFLLCSIVCQKKRKLWKVIFENFFYHIVEVSDSLFRVNRCKWCLKGQLLSFDLWETECVCTLEGWNRNCWSVRPGQWSFSQTEDLVCPRLYGKGGCARSAPSAVWHKGRKLVLVCDYGVVGVRPWRTPSWVSLVSTTAESRIYF